jgi:hypothetical protein
VTFQRLAGDPIKFLENCGVQIRYWKWLLMENIVQDGRYGFTLKRQLPVAIATHATRLASFKVLKYCAVN